MNVPSDIAKRDWAREEAQRYLAENLAKKEKWIRIRSLKDIRRYHASSCSMTWNSGTKHGKRRELSAPSSRSYEEFRYVFYCTEKDWQRAFKLNDHDS